MKRTNFYTQHQQRTARILFTAWILVSCNANVTLAAPGRGGAMVSATSTSSSSLELPPDHRPVIAPAPQQRLSQEALPDKECDLLRTSSKVSLVGENLSFQARGGEKVRFTHQMGQWHAEVLSRIGAFSRQAVLPLVCSLGEDATSSIAALSRYPRWHSQRQIHVLGRNVCPTLGEVVYVGELGLKGGSRGELTESGEERAEALRASSEPAPVAGDDVSLVAHRLKSTSIKS